MENNRKEQERAELHRTIWNMANDLRGSVDGWDFKQYVLGMLFYRYISENITAYINAGEWEAGNTEFDYAKLSDEEAEQARPNHLVWIPRNLVQIPTSALHRLH
jgi:type I restriction enzyme M protein